MSGNELIYSIKQGLSRFEHDLQNDFHTIVVRFQVQSSTVCYGLVRLNTTFTRLTVYKRSHAVYHDLVRSLVRLYTVMALVSVFLKVLKIIHGFHGYTRMAQV